MGKKILFSLIAICIIVSTICIPGNAESPDYAFTKDSFPVIDGSTSCVPLGKAIAAVLLPNENETDDLIDFHKTTQSFRNLTSGACELIISGQPEASVFEEMEAAGFEYRIKPFATDALIFVVNTENPVDNLTTQQIRDIYSGKITNWKEVGGSDAPIAAFQRNPGAGSQALMLKLVMGDIPMAEPVEGFVATEMGMLMEAVKNYDNSANAIGYSVYYYANDMKKAAGLKILSVDGVAPSAETIASGEYPHLNPYYAAISAKLPKDAPASVLYDWITSKDGCRLLSAQGYVPVEADDDLAYHVVSDLSRFSTAETDSVFSRLTSEHMENVSARDDYGAIYPFHGTSFFELYDDESYTAGYYDGLFDSSGRIIADPVYADVSLATYWDPASDKISSLPIWLLKKADGKVLSVTDGWEDIEDRSKVALASADGSFVTECIYDGIRSTKNAVVAVKDKDGTDFTVFDANGNILLTEKDIHFSDRLIPGISPFSISKYDEVYTIELTDGSWLFDSDGEILAGPGYIGEFTEGFAVVSDLESGKHSLIDQAGRNAVDGYFDNITPFHNGIAVFSRDGIVSFEDKEFNVVFSMPGQYGTAYDFGYMVDGKYYDLAGNPIFSDEDQEYWMLLSSGIFYQSDEFGVTLYSYPEDRQLFFEGYAYATLPYTIMSVTDLPFILLNRENSNGNWETLVCDRDFNELIKSEGMISAVENAFTGEAFLVVCENGNCTLFDRDMQKAAEFPVNDNYPALKIYGDTLISSDAEYVTAYHLNDGSVFFRYPVSKLN